MNRMAHNTHSIIVTGASRGLGYALSQVLADAGYRVIAVARSSGTLSQLAAQYSDITRVVADISTAHGRQAVVEAARAAAPVHVIQNAAVFYPGRLEAIDYNEMLSAFETNVIGPWRLFCDLYHAGCFDHSRILQAGSGLAHFSLEGAGSYCLTKAAFYRLYEQINTEFNTSCVSAASLLPAMMATSMPRQLTASERLPDYLKQQFADYQKSIILYEPHEVAVFASRLLLESTDGEYRKEWRFAPAG